MSEKDCIQKHDKQNLIVILEHKISLGVHKSIMNSAIIENMQASMF